MGRQLQTLLLATMLLAAAACRSGGEGTGAQKSDGPTGVDTTQKILVIGALNDESGPAAGIGKPWAIGKRVLARRIAAGDHQLLPKGWKVRLVERDHGYNPQRAVELYGEIKDEVLFIGTSFGTPNTLPLRPMLERDGMIAFPASLSSKMAEHEMTPPIGTPYRLEAMRALDWAVEQAGGAGAVKAGIIYQQDDYGADGLEGWTAAAKVHGVAIVSSQAVAPGQADYTAAVTALKEAGANYVLLTTLASGTRPILETAARLQYAPAWFGNTPAWIDGFFNPKVASPELFRTFHWSTGLPYWGEDVEGMKDFLAAYEKFGKALSPPDFYILLSYAQGLTGIEAFRRALEAGDVSRAGYEKALHSIQDFSPGGLLPPMDLSRFPYVTHTQARILEPDLEAGTWKVVGAYATPEAYKGAKLAGPGAAVPAGN